MTLCNFVISSGLCVHSFGCNISLLPANCSMNGENHLSVPHWNFSLLYYVQNYFHTIGRASLCAEICDWNRWVALDRCQGVDWRILLSLVTFAVRCGTNGETCISIFLSQYIPWQWHTIEKHLVLQAFCASLSFFYFDWEFH